MSEIKIDWLPMGTVVRLLGVETPVMVTGRLQRETEKSETFEYAGCPYPYGFEDSSKSILFNGDAIEHVFFLGYRTQTELDWCVALTNSAKRANLWPSSINNE